MRCLFSFMLIFVACTSVIFSAAGGSVLTNRGFESGDLSGWSLAGIGSAETIGFGIPPTEGTYQAVLLSDDPITGTASSTLEAFLGLAPQTLDNLGQGAVVHGSALKQSINVKSGDTLSFDWNFLTSEDPADPDHADFAFIVLGSLPPVIIASTTSSLPGDTVSPFGGGATGYNHFSYQFSSPGVISFGAGVVDVGGPSGTSALLLDNFMLQPPPSGPTVPLPPVAIMGGILLVCAAVVLRLIQNTSRVH